MTDPPALDEQAAAPVLARRMTHLLLGLFLGGRGRCCHFTVRFALAHPDANSADGQGGQALEAHFPSPAFRHVAAPQPLIDAEQIAHRLGKARDYLPAAHFPVGAAEHDKKVVATDMADEIEPLVDSLAEQAGQDLDHVVAAPVAEGVVEGLEVVDVDIGRDERASTRQHAVDMLVDRHVAPSWVSGLA